jgi:hypothetical protein
MKLKNIPSSDQVAKSVEKFKDFNWPQFDLKDNVDEHIKNVIGLITQEFQHILDYVQPISHKDFNFNIFRVRELSTFKDYNLFCEHSYKPIMLTKDMGRCHFPDHPIFYGSTSAMVALSEVIRNTDFNNKIYCISKWEIIPSKYPILFQPFIFSKLPDDNPYRTVRDSLNINQPFEGKLSDDQIKGIQILLEFLGNLFTFDNTYSVSASLAHRRLYDQTENRTEIMMYPSAQSDYRGVNLAIHPNFVDNRMRLKRVYPLKIKAIENEKGRGNFEMGKIGEVFRSSIFWRDIDPDDKELMDSIDHDLGYAGKVSKNETAEV